MAYALTSMLNYKHRDSSEERGGEILVLLFYFELQTCIERFLLPVKENLSRVSRSTLACGGGGGWFELLKPAVKYIARKKYYLYFHGNKHQNQQNATTLKNPTLEKYPIQIICNFS